MWQTGSHVSGDTYDRCMQRRRYSEQRLAETVARSKNLSEVLMRLGLSPSGGNYESVRRFMSLTGVDAAHLGRSRSGSRPLGMCSDDEVASAVAASRSLAGVLRELRVRQGGGSQSNLKARIARLSLDTSHFTGVAWRSGQTKPVVPAAPIEDVLVLGRFVQTTQLRRRLVAEGLKEPRCERCGRHEWNGQPVPLELDHVNGRREDNRLANLRLLCPNCHAQTDTYRGRNIGRRRTYAEVRPGAGTGETERS